MNTKDVHMDDKVVPHAVPNPGKQYNPYGNNPMVVTPGTPIGRSASSHIELDGPKIIEEGIEQKKRDKKKGRKPELAFLRKDEEEEEFKMLSDPSGICDDIKDVRKSCEDLAIDG